MIDRLMQHMQNRHSRLFQSLARLDAAIVRIEPTDIPHAFILSYGQGVTSLTLAKSTDQPCDACIKGKLESLLDMLEGRIDGDMMFFLRDINIIGNISVIVSLRNTLDREEINLVEDMTSMCGPFAAPARGVVRLVNICAERVKTRLGDIYDARHPALGSGIENEALRTEIKTLKRRLATFEVRQQRREAITS